MKSKICLITGATSGIGHQTAIQLAQAGWSINFIARKKEAAESTLQILKEINPTGNHGYFLADLMLVENVKKVAAEIIEKLPNIDVLLNNAGGVNASKILTSEGFERTLALNHLSYFTLTISLLPILKNTHGARIVNVASDSHYSGKLDFNNLNGEKSYFIFQQYANTKLMNVLFTRELARKLRGTGITANCLHPGMVRTKIGNKNTNPFIGAAWNIMAMLRGITEEEGARTSFYLADSDEIKDITGEYFDNCKPKKPSRLAQDDSLAEALWKRTAEMTKIDMN
jgi:NAD(P)-dependent dehydrogenase (short-subunit alcohol dehydrogenase family)